ncbi:MAG TPA: glycosyl hydrolase family 28-related protein [Acidimicrobiales bacterium]|nr:glycosyl hydrolase family 28-related protein [Acidimicrobiales bacterium]
MGARRAGPATSRARYEPGALRWDGLEVTWMVNGPGGYGPFLDVREFGAKGDGVTDDTGALRAAIVAASPGSAPTGNVVYLPAGAYMLTSSLELPPGVSLQGSGWNTPGAQVNTFAGTWLFVGQGANFSPVVLAGNGSAVRNLAFNVRDQPTTVPVPEAQPMVLVTANNVLIEDVFLYNPYGGIAISGAAQASLRRIWGQPLQYGIAIDRSQDVNFIDTVHFWPYWQPQGTPVGRYQLANATALVLYRCDNPHLSNIFAYNFARGISLAGSEAGIPHKVHLVNADFDRCVTGVHIRATGRPGSAATIQMANVTVQSPAGDGIPQGHGVWVEAASSFAMVQASNVRVSNSGLCGVRIDADNVTFFADNISLEGWRGPSGFSVASRSSLVYLGAGFSAAGNGSQVDPRAQFRMASYS